MGSYRIPAFSSTFFGNVALVSNRNAVDVWKSKTVCLSAQKQPVANVHLSNEALETTKGFPSTSRRTFVRDMGLLTFSLLLANSKIDETLAEDAVAAFSTYKGPVSLGYSFSYPSSWNLKKKPIKTHLSEIIVTDDSEASTSAGVVVDAVKIDSIDTFGTPDMVGQKVIAVEAKKESVKEALLTSASAVTKDGLTYYVIDYTVDSTRGFRRYKAKATVTGNQLYVFTAQAKVDNFTETVDKTLSQMLDSFNVVKQYL